jgi:hypothetical protein
MTVCTVIREKADHNFGGYLTTIRMEAAQSKNYFNIFKSLSQFSGVPPAFSTTLA